MSQSRRSDVLRVGDQAVGELRRQLMVGAAAARRRGSGAITLDPGRVSDLIDAYLELRNDEG